MKSPLSEQIAEPLPPLLRHNLRLWGGVRAGRNVHPGVTVGYGVSGIFFEIGWPAPGPVGTFYFSAFVRRVAPRLISSSSLS
jgi:hypothetical protein